MIGRPENFDEMRNRVVELKAELKRLNKILHRHNISEALLKRSLNGERVGRPSKMPREKIFELHKKGMSLGLIAKELKISKGGVSYTIKGRKT